MLQQVKKIAFLLDSLDQELFTEIERLSPAFDWDLCVAMSNGNHRKPTRHPRFSIVDLYSYDGVVVSTCMETLELSTILPACHFLHYAWDHDWFRTVRPYTENVSLLSYGPVITRSESRGATLSEVFGVVPAAYSSNINLELFYDTATQFSLHNRAIQNSSSLSS